MIREEIEKSRSYQSGKAAVEYAKSIPQSEKRKRYCIEDFEAGVEWADAHPRKGLVDIDRVCEFLRTYDKAAFPYRLIDDLRKIME